MKVACLIPARLQSTRLAQKLLQALHNLNVVQTTYSNVLATQLFSEVIVITDSQEIADSIHNINGKVLMSSKMHETGTDRIAEFAHTIDADIFINVQADEPFTNKEILEKLIAEFVNTQTQVASLMHIITDASQINNTSCVKVICDINNNAILFSRNPIPYNRDAIENILYYKHIGIYAFTKNALMQFAALPQAKIELAEQLENLRFIYNNISVKMIETNYTPIGIDTLDDLEKARKLFL